MRKCDLRINDIFVYSSVFKKFYEMDVYILDGKIFYLDQKKERTIEVEREINGIGKFMVPGLIVRCSLRNTWKRARRTWTGTLPIPAMNAASVP